MTNNPNTTTDALREACDLFRDAVLNGRHQLEEPCLDSDQTNAVLGLFDDVVGTVLDAQTPAPASAMVEEGVRLFPLQKSDIPNIPWSVAAKAYKAYAAQYGKQQSLERLAERGGFGAREMDMLYPAWRDEVAELEMLRKKVAELTALLAQQPAAAGSKIIVGDSVSGETFESLLNPAPPLGNPRGQKQ